MVTARIAPHRPFYEPGEARFPLFLPVLDAAAQTVHAYTVGLALESIVGCAVAPGEHHEASRRQVPWSVS